MMKLLPGLFSDAFDDMFYDRSNMKTDIRMKDGNYVLDMELPGYQKENIQMELKEGYLTIHASRNTTNEGCQRQSDSPGTFLRLLFKKFLCRRRHYAGGY